VILAFLAILQVANTDTPQVKQASFSEFLALVKAKSDGPRVESVTVKEKEYAYTVVDPNGVRYQAVALGPAASDDLLKVFDEQKVKVTFEKDEGTPFWTSALITALPMVFLLAIFYMFMRQLQGGGGKAMTFGKAKPRMLNELQNGVTFADVAGINEAKDELEEIIAFLRDPKKFQRLGGRIPKGVLMMGPPGTGKTLLARAIAGEAGVPFFSISGSDFVEMFVGVGASRVRDLFEQGKKHAPCIVFIDEIDAVGRHRGAGLGGGHDEREQTLNQLLVEMDGFESNEGVIIIAATNRPDVLDPAILRPGRFDRRITVPRPDVVGREGILRVHTKKVPLGEDVDLETIARGTPGFVGADLENLVNEAALLATRLDKDAVEMADIEIAKDKVLMGTERRSMVMSDKERRIAAWHEAGHTLVGMFVDGNDEIHKVSIIPRGAALGVTQFLPTEDRHMMSKKQALARIAMALGGRSAEELVFGEITTGASNDIRQATQIARMMVCEVGMSEKLGPVSYGEREDSIFLGREFAQHRPDYSDTTAVHIDDEIKRIIEEQHSIARSLLADRKEALDRLAEALLDRETLDQEEIKSVIDGRVLPPRKKVVIPTWSERAEQSKETKRGKSIFGSPKPALP